MLDRLIYRVDLVSRAGSQLKGVLVPLWIVTGALLLVLSLLRRREPRRPSRAEWVWAGAYLLLGPVLAVVQLAESPAEELARRLLSVAGQLGTALLSPWTLVAGVVLVVLWPALPALRTALGTRLRSLEVGPVRLELGAASESVTLIIPPPAALEGLAESTPYGEMAGSDGPVLERPAATDPAYVACLQALPALFAELSDGNQDSLADRLRNLEAPWAGEYVEELALSVRNLGFYAARNRVVLRGYLAKTLIFRYLMVFYFGRADAARDLVVALPWVEPVERRRFLRHEASIRVAVGLASQRDWITLASLVEQAGQEALEAERAALAGYLSLLQGQPDRARQAVAPPVTETDWGPYAALASVVRAEGALVSGRALDAVAPARAVITSPLPRDRGVGRGLRVAAGRTLARAGTVLGMADALHELYSHPEVGSDPDVLNSLAVHAARCGQHAQARALLGRATALLTPETPAGIAFTIQSNLAALEGVR